MVAHPYPGKWDEIDPMSLLRLVPVRRISREFGFLFRHYWMPGTRLTYHRTQFYDTKNNEAVPVIKRIFQHPGPCTADIFLWREIVQNISDDPVEQAAERFCIYNRSTQTFRTRNIIGNENWPESEEDARLQAMLHQPILTPLLPIPLGFQWHVAGETGYMDFQLESETKVADMTVLFIRRKGRLAMKEIGDMDREGMTAYALERSMILEDRICDHIASTRTRTLTLTKLVESAIIPSLSEEV